MACEIFTDWDRTRCDHSLIKNENPESARNTSFVPGPGNSRKSIEVMEHKICSVLSIIVMLLSCSLTGCGTLPNGRTWGQDATLTPGWDHLTKSVHHAFLAPDVIVPAIAAGLLQIDHVDARISDWAVEHTPLFGSSHNARVASDYGYILAETAYGVSVIATPAAQTAASGSGRNVRARQSVSLPIRSATI